MSAPVTMYTKGWCDFCARARALLERKGVKWTEINLEDQPERAAEMLERTGRRTVPQIFIGDRHIGGAEELRELDQAGALDALLAQHAA
jgi:glutaredoxin 3